jgi:hypothetical protein
MPGGSRKKPSPDLDDLALGVVRVAGGTPLALLRCSSPCHGSALGMNLSSIPDAGACGFPPHTDWGGPQRLGGPRPGADESLA